MNVEIGTEAAQFPEKEYVNGIFVAVWSTAGRTYCIQNNLLSGRWIKTLGVKALDSLKVEIVIRQEMLR